MSAQPSALTPQAPPNRFLLRWRGHGRQWPDEALDTFYEAMRKGLSIQRACDKAGIPQSTLYWMMANDQELKTAVGEVYAHEGADGLEARVDDGIDGTLSHKRAQYVRMALELRGRLGRGAGHTQINVDARTLLVHMWEQGAGQQKRLT